MNVNVIVLMRVLVRVMVSVRVGVKVGGSTVEVSRIFGVRVGVKNWRAKASTVRMRDILGSRTPRPFTPGWFRTPKRTRREILALLSDIHSFWPFHC